MNSSLELPGCDPHQFASLFGLFIQGKYQDRNNFSLNNFFIFFKE